MRYRVLGRTGLKVSELCFGAMTFGGAGGKLWETFGALDQQAANEMVARCLDTGVNFFDTANFYAGGESEVILGEALRARRREVVIATKVRFAMGPGPNDVGLSRGHILDAVDDSLRRLKTDYLDLYQIHLHDPLTPLDETLRALEDLVRWGKVRYLGASNLAAWQLMKAIGNSERRGFSRFESLQAYYSLASRELEREIVPLLLDQQVGLMVWSPLSGGLLSGKFTRDAPPPPDARATSFDILPVNRERLYSVVDELGRIAAARGASVARVALAWLLTRPAVTSVVIGARRLDQLEDNLRCTELAFTAEELAQLDVVSALPPEYPGFVLSRATQDRGAT